MHKRDPNYHLRHLREEPFKTRSEYAFEAFVKQLRNTNYKKEMQNARHDLEAIQIKATSSAQIRRGNNVLDKLRSEVPKELFLKLQKNENNLQLTMLSEYLNGYC